MKTPNAQGLLNTHHSFVPFIISDNHSLFLISTFSIASQNKKLMLLRVFLDNNSTLVF